MSVVGEATAIIGIADVALKSIKSLYDLLQAIEDAPELIARVRIDVRDIQAKLKDLEFLSEADPRTVAEIGKTNIAKVIDDCGVQCDLFEKLLGKWIKHTEKSLRDRVRVALNQARIQKYRTVLWSAARELDSAVGILTLKINVSDRSPEQQAAILIQLKEDMASWRAEADGERNVVSQRLTEVAQSDEDEADFIHEELDQSSNSLEQFMQRCDELRAVKLHIEITNIHTGEEADVKLGMPEAAVDKVSRARFSNVRTEKKGKAQISIW